MLPRPERLITDRASNVTQGLPNEWMMMLMTEKETCHEIMDRSVDATIRCLGLDAAQAVGDACFAWGVAADDAGTQRREFLRPDLWAEMIKPHYKKLCDWIHAATPWKTFLHSCGSVYHLVPHFIEAGIDILNPVQTSAANMDPGQLKREFGDRLVFWGGGCDTQSVLGQSRPDEIRARRERSPGHLLPRRRLRIQPGPQHPGERAAGKRHRHVRRRLRVRRLWGGVAVHPSCFTGRHDSAPLPALRLRPANHFFSSPDVHVWDGRTTVLLSSSAPLGAKPIIPPLKGLKEKNRGWSLPRPRRKTPELEKGAGKSRKGGQARLIDPSLRAAAILPPFS